MLFLLPTKSWVVNSRLNRFYLYWLSTPSIVRDGSWTLEDNRWILSCNSRMSVCVCIWLTEWSRSGIAKYCSRKNVWWRWSASGSKSIISSLMYCVLVLKSSLPWKTFPQVHLLNEKKPNSKHNEPHKFCHAAAGLSYCPTVCHMGTSCAQVAVSHKQMESKLRTDLFVPSAPVGMQFIDRRRNVSIVGRLHQVRKIIELAIHLKTQQRQAVIECHRLLVGEPHRNRLVTLREAFEFHLHNAKSQTKTTVRDSTRGSQEDRSYESKNEAWGKVVAPMIRNQLHRNRRVQRSLPFHERSCAHQ